MWTLFFISGGLLNIGMAIWCRMNYRRDMRLHRKIGRIEGRIEILDMVSRDDIRVRIEKIGLN